MTIPQPAARTWWWRLVLAALAAVLGVLLGATTASAAALPTVETRVGAIPIATPTTVGFDVGVWASQHRVNSPPQADMVVGRGVAAKTGSGAENVATARKLQAQLAGEELAGADGHAFVKHVIEQGEFPGIRTRAQFADMIEDVVLNGERRVRNGGATAYWRNGVIVIRNPKAADGGTVFAPKEGYSYFTRNFQAE